MLRPLLFLFALTAVPGAAGGTVSVNTELDISSCPVTYFGQQYEKAFVNITSGHFVVCFDGFYNPQGDGDCLLAPPASSASFNIFTATAGLFFHVVPTIDSSMKCYLTFSLPSGFFYAINYGTQEAVGLQIFVLGTYAVDVLLNGSKVDQLIVTNTRSKLQLQGYTDVSGCRHEGAVFEPGKVVSSDAATCSNLTCNATALLETITCGPMETCDGKGVCAMTTTTTEPPTTPTPVHSICTVTGPSVIDFSGQLDSVNDRCAHYLLTVDGLSVVGYFLDRRLANVSFLDSVSIELDQDDIHLTQGGRVLLNNSTLNLDSSPQMVHGAEISKDQTGVTVNVQINSLKFIIFFDGNTALIFVEGPGSTGSPPTGLCQDSSIEARLPGCSSMSCVPLYNQTEDTICPNNTESCFHLNKAPFNSCDIDPKPYFDACTDTLSRYPAVDGLKCQFLEAYARACSLYSNTTLEGWRSRTECHHDVAYCYNTTCSDHEFCAEEPYGDTRCFCRANFACEHKNRYAYGHPPVCKKHHASLTLYNCLLEEENIDYTVLHLNDPTCRGHLDEKEHTVTFTFRSDTCATEIINNSSRIIYMNSITNDNVTDDIIRQRTVKIDFSCYNTQPDILTKAFTVIDSPYTEVIVPGLWNYTLSIEAYIDDGCTKLVDAHTPILLNEKVCVKLRAKWLNENLVVLVTDHCWATDEPSPTAAPRYDLIKNGCPADPTVMTRGNGKDVFNYFSFNMFEFTGGSNNIYLHCQVLLCVKNSNNNNCAPMCASKRRRRSSKSQYDSPTLISMGWTS